MSDVPPEKLERDEEAARVAWAQTMREADELRGLGADQTEIADAWQRANDALAQKQQISRQLVDVLKLESIDEGHYRLKFPEIGVTLAVDHLHRDRGALQGELVVECRLPGARTFNGILSIGDYNLSSVRARKERASYLAARAQTVDTVDWTGMLEEFSQRVLAAERLGQPAVSLRDLPRPAAEDALVVDGVTLLAQHPEIWFGDGGAGKSYLGLHVAGVLAKRGLRVALFDWELAGEEHRLRLEGLFGAEMPDVRYARCARPLVYEVDRLRRIVRESRLNYLIFDSVAFACDGPPEAAEVAGRYFQALRSLGPAGSLHIAHISKQEGSDRKPFGSVFWHNGARSTWNVKLAESDPADPRITVGLYHRKANLGALQPAVGLEISFEGERTHVRRVNLAAVGELAQHMPIRQRMAAALRHGELDPKVLAEKIEASVETIGRTARRYPEQFVVLNGGRLGLLERKAS